MSQLRTLSPEQVEQVRTYFKALARLRGEVYVEPGDGLLSALTETYCTIQLEGGGDPVRAAQLLA